MVTPDFALAGRALASPAPAAAVQLAARAENAAFFNATAIPLSVADDWTVCVAASDEATTSCCAAAAGVRCPVWGCRLSLKDSSQQSTFTTCTDKAADVSTGGRRRACEAYPKKYEQAVKQLAPGAGWWAAGALADGETVCTAFGGRNESAAACCTAASGQRQAADDKKKTPETCKIADKDKGTFEKCVQEKLDAYAVCTSAVVPASSAPAKAAAPTAAPADADSAAPRVATSKAALALAALALTALGHL